MIRIQLFLRKIIIKKGELYKEKKKISINVLALIRN